LNRRRFLKYAAFGAAVAGSFLAGYELDRWQTSSAPRAPTSTVTKTQTLSETLTETVRLASLHGRLFFDYNGNGTQDGEEPAVAGALVQLKDSTGDVVAEALTDSSGDYRLEDIRAGRFRLHVAVEHFSDRRFTHMCTSPNEFTAVTEDYEVALQQSTNIDIGLMEGFLTLPMSSKTRYEIDRFYDRDPNPDTYLWWNGKKGLETSAKRGFAPNHGGIDYYMKEGEPLLAQGPGVVETVGEDERGRYIWIKHPYGFRTSSGHISTTLVREGDAVSRGQPIAKSGSTYNQYPHTHQQLTTQSSTHRVLLDPYAPEFEIKPQYSGYYDMASGFPFLWVSAPADSSNPNLLNYWTKNNDPQYPTS
jgi:hypothetical protein